MGIREDVADVQTYLNNDSLVDVEARRQQLLNKLDDYLDTSEIRDILADRGNLLTISCAGAGKTTLLVLKIIFDQFEFENTDKVLVSTFLNSGADDIRKTYLAWCNKLKVTPFHSIAFRTLHSTFNELLVGMGVRLNICEPSVRFELIKDLCKMYNFFRKNTVNKEELADIDLLISYTSNSIDDVTRHAVLDKYNISKATWVVAYDKFLQLKRAKGIYDYDDMQTTLYKAYDTNPAVREFAAKRYTYMYLDEFQDTSNIQYALLRPMLDAVKRMTIIGDDDQTIYSWRGSNINIILRYITSHYSVNLKYLTVNRRSKAGVLEPVIPCITHNTDRFPKPLKAYAEGGKSVVVPMYSGSKIKLSLDYLVDLCKKTYETGGTLLIVGRANADLSIPILYLANTDYGFTVAGKSMNPTKGTIYGYLTNALRLFQTGRLVTKSALDLLGLTPVEINTLLPVIHNNNVSLFEIDPQDIKSFNTNLADLITNMSKADTVAKKILFLYTYIREHHFKDKDNAFCRAVYNLFEFILGTLVKDTNTISDLLIVLNRISTNIELLSKSNVSDGSVVFSTVHEAKGKGYTRVVIWNASQGVFPVKSKADMDQDVLEEERRVFYIAWTRAEEEVYIFTDTTCPSEFLLECDLTKVVDGDKLCTVDYSSYWQ